ncbi:class I SAM-dependent methyltransferase [Ruegeria arenilitoris]|uniref:class I SAM-dependent methyltransferase n=1 Tax=Ruegeria arenilitoris TaxID=1173585 RepID=UPI00147BB7CC|nr:class I SAM-dependent methyltransferase [Ruegeria arenilitoris]
MSPRLSLAIENGLTLSQPVSFIGATPANDLPKEFLGSQVVQPFKPFHDHFASIGFAAIAEADSTCHDAVVFLPRSKELARAMICQACRRASHLVVVDGAKTDGIDSLLKDIRKKVSVEGPISKAHGKIFWFHSDEQAFADWAAPEMQTVDGFNTVPGVFSADGIDPASELLSKALPPRLGAKVADLGAGWGYLSSHLLRDKNLVTLHLVEADHAALCCARTNVKDPRAKFHWADALKWTAAEPLDAVVMNPPFHTSRDADPGLGQGFIRSAAHNLARSGELWMVANRHLPYEATLSESFARVEEVTGDNRFKVIRASRPRR